LRKELLAGARWAPRESSVCGELARGGEKRGPEDGGSGKGCIFAEGDKRELGSQIIIIIPRPTQNSGVRPKKKKPFKRRRRGGEFSMVQKGADALKISNKKEVEREEDTASKNEKEENIKKKQSLDRRNGSITKIRKYLDYALLLCAETRDGGKSEHRKKKGRHTNRKKVSSK